MEAKIYLNFKQFDAELIELSGITFSRSTRNLKLCTKPRIPNYVISDPARGSSPNLRHARFLESMVAPSRNYPANNSGSAVEITIEGRGTRGHDWRFLRDDRCDRQKSQNPYPRLGKVSIESLHLSIVLYWNQKDYDTGSTGPGSVRYHG